MTKEMAFCTKCKDRHCNQHLGDDFRIEYRWGSDPNIKNRPETIEECPIRGSREKEDTELEIDGTVGDRTMFLGC